MTTRSDRISSLLLGATSTRKVPGVAVAAVLPDGEVVSAASGVRNIVSGAEMLPDSVVWIASLTKAITATAAMQLVEQGKLALDTPIARELPSLANMSVLEGFGPDGAPKLRPARAAITLRHLLTHTSGFAYNIWNQDLTRYLEVMRKPSVSSCQNAALALPLIFDPGTDWVYGIGIEWTGKAIEAVSGMTLGRYLTKYLFEPLGMRDTGFRIRDDQRPRLASMHARKPEGIVAIDMEIPQSPEFELGGGGLYSTMGDYLRFARMILDGGILDGTRVLAESTVETMRTNAMGALRCRKLRTAAPGTTNDVDFHQGMQWGLSFLINPEPLPTGRSAGSLAWAGLANSYYWIDSKKNVAGVFTTQLFPFFDAEAVALFNAFETAIYEMA